MNLAVIALVSFMSGFFTGHETSAVTVVCRDESLIALECVDIHPPQDETFGATTSAYISLVGQYRKCKQACTGGEAK